MNSNIKPKVEGNKIHISDEYSIFPSTFGFILLFIRIERLTCFSEQNKNQIENSFGFLNKTRISNIAKSFLPIFLIRFTSVLFEEEVNNAYWLFFMQNRKFV